MSAAQVLAVIQLLVAFNVPPATVAQVQGILQPPTVVVAISSPVAPYMQDAIRSAAPKPQDPIVGTTWDTGLPVHRGTGLYIIDAKGCHEDVVKNKIGYATYQIGWCPN